MGIGIAIGVTGLIASSNLSLSGSRINKQELLAKAASYSGITRLRALFNDNTKGRLFNYFWLVNNCSEKSNECQETRIANPSNEFWTDDSWCDGEINCNGRQKAPLCSSNSDFSWDQEQNIVSDLYKKSNYIRNSMNTSQGEFNQLFNILSSKYIGTEEYGINSILIEGSSKARNSANKSASNKLRVNIQVNGETSESGFGFISVGEKNSDKTDSLFLGNLNITPSNSAKGSIIWRMNVDNELDCRNSRKLARASNSSLPKTGNGGIWIQPLALPKQPRLKNVKDIGTLICTKENYKKNNSKCKLDSDNLNQKTYRIYSLFAKGPNSKFEVITSDNKKIILEIMGDIDISNGGEFCHRNGNEPCGSGKPENLTILFKQKSAPRENKLMCNRDSNNGGIKLNKRFAYSTNFPLNNDLLPGNSFLIDNTGKFFNSEFGAFVYGPKTTFLSVIPKSNWIQINNEKNSSNNLGLVVTSRGSYGYILNTAGTSLRDQTTNLILNSDLTLIPYSGENNSTNNIEIIGIGKKRSEFPANSELDPNTNNVFLIFDSSNSNYHLRSFNVRNINSLNNKNFQNSYPRAFAILNPKNNLNNINLGNNLEENSLANSWLSAFDIKVQNKNTNYIRNFSGATWVKNLCFDNASEKNWRFSNNFIDKLVSWHGNQFNWGVKYYRGKSIILWDTLRDFQLN